MKKLYEKKAALALILNGLIEAARKEERAFTPEEISGLFCIFFLRFWRNVFRFGNNFLYFRHGWFFFR